MKKIENIATCAFLTSCVLLGVFFVLYCHMRIWESFYSDTFDNYSQYEFNAMVLLFINGIFGFIISAIVIGFIQSQYYNLVEYTVIKDGKQYKSEIYIEKAGIDQQEEKDFVAVCMKKQLSNSSNFEITNRVIIK